MIIEQKTIHNVQQGTDSWLKLRARFFTASEAPAARGVSRYTSRSELLRQKATGLTAEHDNAKQILFAQGHASESAARPMAESFLQDELYPVTVTAEIDGVPLLASMDGLTMDDSVAWETKFWNEELAANVKAGTLPEHYTIQMDQQLAVSGAKRCFFTCTDGTPDRFVSCWYESSEEKIAQLISTWKQFAKDLADWQPELVVVEPVAAPVEGFGSLVLRVEGRVTACNMDAFKAQADAFIARLPKAAELSTDQDFANAESAVKACAEAEDRIKAALDVGLSSMADVDAVFRAARQVSDTLRAARLALDKAVKAQKDAVRFEKIDAAEQAFTAHVSDRQLDLPGVTFAPPRPLFADAIKGLKSIRSIDDKLATALAKGKIDADQMAAEWRKKLAYFNDAAASHKALFADLKTLIAKPEEDFRMAVAHRINQFEAAEEQRRAAARERIAAEERAKIEAEERAKAEAALRTAVQTPAGGGSLQTGENTGSPGSANSFVNPSPAEAATVAEPPASAEHSGPALADSNEKPSPLEIPSLRLGQINQRLAPLSIDAAGLASLGFPHAATDKAAKLYHERNWPAICRAIAAHVMTKTSPPCASKPTTATFSPSWNSLAQNSVSWSAPSTPTARPAS
ncbi:MAG: YqaJ viral recombinase family protein, partial [Desulfobulbus sp.]|nr:YqaJ viral recombinase family protein [Desulfobulbus sp.]